MLRYEPVSKCFFIAKLQMLEMANGASSLDVEFIKPNLMMVSQVVETVEAPRFDKVINLDTGESEEPEDTCQYTHDTWKLCEDKQGVPYFEKRFSQFKFSGMDDLKGYPYKVMKGAKTFGEVVDGKYVYYSFKNEAKMVDGKIKVDVYRLEI